MCGRFTLTTNDYRAVAEALDAELRAEDVDSYRARYNVAPGDRHVVVMVEHEAQRIVRAMWPAIWGLPGERASRPEGHINARAETAHARPAFRDAFLRGRCAVPADGFYEWTGPKDHRLPIWYHGRRTGGVIALAGLASETVDPISGEVQRRFAILTTEANPLVAPVHDRMPVILAPDELAVWLRPEATVDELRSVLHPAPEDLLVATEVSARANKVAHDDPACIAPWPHPRQTTLF